MANEIINTLAAELVALEGLHGQNPETGAGIGTGTSYLSAYTNRIFGAPYQFMDSVDRRFEEVNTHVGNEYLRNFILNSPILYIRPGMPIYTGGSPGNTIIDSIKSIYLAGTSGNMTFIESLLQEAASKTIFASGSKLQKRMFGFRETYYQYMSHVNYMCRSMAVFLGLTTSTKFPVGTFCNSTNGDVMLPFEVFKWENYRMLTNAVPMLPRDYYKALSRSTLLGAIGWGTAYVIADLTNGAAMTAQGVAKSIVDSFQDGGTILENLFDNTNVAGMASGAVIGGAAGAAVGGVAGAVVGATAGGLVGGNIGGIVSDIVNDTVENFNYFTHTSTTDVIVDKVSSVLFMVEPSQYEETYTNRTEDSMIASTVNGIADGIGQELAFITNSNVDFGVLDDITSFLGNTVQTATSFLAGLVKPVTGGFITNLINHGMHAVQGQKMIYPKIYKGSESSKQYNFTVKLISPYGDVYNYYMNIVVPLMHLLALVAPRMVTSNTVASPYLVQASVPGQCTCELGIIPQMTVTKNPDGDRVSVHGFPLEVEVKFTIEPLYNSFSISPANDPAAFLFNETLNDYMSNLAGLRPSTDTYTKQRKSMFESLQKYFDNKEYLDDLANARAQKIEVRYNSAIANGSG